MSGINFMGSYSGIDMSVVDQLIEAESAKGVQYTNKKENIKQEQNAWKDINTRLDSLFQKVDVLTQKETFESRTVSSSIGERSSLDVSAGEDAAEGQYRIQVQQLAQSTRLTGGQLDIDSIHDALGVSGELSISAEGMANPFTIDVTAEDSLKDISTKINEATIETADGETKDLGIQATIIDDRLVLTDTTLGDRALDVSGSVAGSVAGDLGFGEIVEIDDSADQQNVPEGQATLNRGQGSVFTIDGLVIERSSNTIDDAIEGLTFNLNNIHEGNASEVITVESDIEKTTNAVQEFVDQYNSVMNFIDQQMDVGNPGQEGNTTGALTGDGTLMRLQSNLRSLMTQNLNSNLSGEFKNIEDIGITIDRDGIATLDTDVFQSAMQEDPANVGRFFYQEDAIVESVDDNGEVTQTTQERQGLSELLKNFIDTYISESNGIISNKNDTYDRMIKDIDRQIETFNNRLDRKRDRYIQQFTALDTAMMQAESQMNYMMSQLGMDQQQ